MMEGDTISYEDEFSTGSELLGDFSELVQGMVKKRKGLHHYTYDIDIAKEQFTNSVKAIAIELKDHYQDFINEKKSQAKTGIAMSSDELGDFTKHLAETGTYISIRNTLKKKLIPLLDQKFRIPYSSWDNSECQNFIAAAYLYLVEEMHDALNTGFEGEVFQNRIDTKNNFLYYAEECYELGNIEAARDNYLRLIVKNRTDPNLWLKYAIFLRKINDLERCIECCLEALYLDNRQKLTLLFYGVLLAEKQNYHQAEIFLKASASLYPRMLESWVILYLFYILTESTQDADMALKIGEECLADESRDKMGIDFLENEPFSWSTFQHCSEDRIFIIITIFLLKLHLYNFADIALKCELEISGRSVQYIYFSAVMHFLQGEYSEALLNLEEARIEHGKDFSIMSLMGHCYEKNGDSLKAMECYEFCAFVFDRPDDTHLVDLKLGNYQLDIQEYEKAKKTFFQVCKNSPTASCWLGLGSACYHLGQLREAELALMESNSIDNRNPETWAYLTLLSIALERRHEFLQCYRQTIQNDLKNSKLSCMIREAIDASDFHDPEYISSN